MSGNALKSAREGLAQAQSFQAEQNGKPLSGEDRQTLRRMTDHMLDNADLHRRNTATSAAEHRNAVTADKTAELRAERERQLPESLRGEPTKSERLLQAAKEGRRVSEVFDWPRAARFADLAAAGATREELNLVTGTVGAGGYWVPDEWETYISGEFRDVEGVSQAVTPIVTDHSRDIYVMTRSEITPSAAAHLSHSSTIATFLSAEASTARVDLEETYARATLQSFKVFQKQPVSAELLEDAAVNVGREVAYKSGRYFAEFQELCWTNGNGTNQPKGAFNAVQAGREVETATAATLTIPDMAELLLGPVVNRNRNSFLISRAAWINTLAAETGPDWGSVSIDEGGQQRLYGFPVFHGMFINPSTAANANPAGFGDWNQLLATRVFPIRITASNPAESDTDEVTFRLRTFVSSALRQQDAATYISIKA